MKHYDWVIREAFVFDGHGGPAWQADVAVEAGRIAAVGPGLGPGQNECSARGLCLAPGFIDVHAHDDFVALVQPELPFKLLQGVTTEVLGNCGIGAAPREGARLWLERFHPGLPVPDYTGYAGYLTRLEEAGPALNLAVLAGHGSLREFAAPGSRTTLSASERTKQLGLLDEALDAGVVGLSSGLIYEPGRYADEAELVELCRRLVGRAPLYATHLRSEGEGLLEAVDEALRVAETAGVSLQLSHHKAQGRENWGKVEQTLGKVDAALGRGSDVWLDVYPYTAGSTILSAILDMNPLTGRARLDTMEPTDLVVATVRGHAELTGCSLGELMLRWGLDKARAAEQLLSLDKGAWVLVHSMREADVQTVMRHPRTLFGSDGLPVSEGQPHPRLWGTFPRILGHYSRELGVLDLAEAISRMTAHAARRFGLSERGEIRQGAHADLVLFDGARVVDVASYDDPQRAPVGIVKVWVNGELAVEDGKLQGRRSGRVLRSH